MEPKIYIYIAGLNSIKKINNKQQDIFFEWDVFIALITLNTSLIQGKIIIFLLLKIAYITIYTWIYNLLNYKPSLINHPWPPIKSTLDNDAMNILEFKIPARIEMRLKNEG